MLALWASPARAEPPPAPFVQWQAEWREFGWEDYLLTSLAAATAVGAQLLPEEPERWSGGGVLFDEGARRTLRFRSEHGELYAKDTSDVLMLLSVAHPFLFDSLTVAWWHHQNPRVATEMALISAEVFAVSSAIQATVSGLTSRERPYGRRCGDDLSELNVHCKQRDRYRSFFSGHTSVSFASAAVTCMHHQHIPLYGGGPPEHMTCAIGFANAAAVGLMRVAADRHYVSDVLVGATVGTLTGLTLPWFLHYRPAEERYARSLSLRVMPTVGGVSIGGDF
jgi:membrane-associated phospholipid phosphatase